MIGKAGLVAAIAVAAVVSGRSIHVHELYDQMYPVSTLKRDVLNLCHENDLTFVRAWREDRVACYSGMPHEIVLALGFIHPSHALSEMFSPPGGRITGRGSLLAGAGLADQLVMSREPPLTAGPAPAKNPCRTTAIAGLDKTPVHSIDDEEALKVLYDRRRMVDPQARMPTSAPDQSDSLTLLDDSAPGHGGPAPTQGAASVGCSSQS